MGAAAGHELVARMDSGLVDSPSPKYEGIGYPLSSMVGVSRTYMLGSSLLNSEKHHSTFDTNYSQIKGFTNFVVGVPKDACASAPQKQEIGGPWLVRNASWSVLQLLSSDTHVNNNC